MEQDGIPNADCTGEAALLDGEETAHDAMPFSVKSDEQLRLDLLDSLAYPLIAPHMKNALRSFIRHLAAHNGERAVVCERDAEFLEAFLFDIIQERNHRADEIESAEVREAAEIANSLFPFPPFGIVCVDGRVNMTLKFGMVGGMKGGSIQLPAGDPTEFVEGRSGELFLLEGSDLERQLCESLERSEVLCEILDSHVGCAARKKAVEEIGEPSADDGLLADVRRKKRIAAALIRYAREKHGKKILPVLGSFDPHNGYSYFGLDKDQVMEHAETRGGFTHEVLEELEKRGEIGSTKAIAEEFQGEFEAQWSQFGHSYDWKGNYQHTALMFWRSMKELKSQFGERIKQMIVAIYPHLAAPEHAHELDMATTLRLANAFVAFCNNHAGHYEFANHEEEFVSVTPRDYRPFHTMSFGVYDRTYRVLPKDTVFASGIVRANRAIGRVDAPPEYASQQEFAAAPVAVVVKEVYRGEVSEVQWRQLEQIDWSSLEHIAWEHMSNAEFMHHLGNANKAISIDMNLALAICELRKKMACLYNPEEASSQQLVSGKLVALPVICDASRRFRLLVPFVMKGFDGRHGNVLKKVAA